MSYVIWLYKYDWLSIVVHVFQKERANRVLFERHKPLCLTNHITISQPYISCIKRMGCNTNARSAFVLQHMCLMLILYLLYLWHLSKEHVIHITIITLIWRNKSLNKNDDEYKTLMNQLKTYLYMIYLNIFMQWTIHSFEYS